jgi:hypothetical protein
MGDCTVIKMAPAAALPVLLLGADQRAEYEGAEQTHQRVDEVGKIERMQNGHRSAIPMRGAKELIGIEVLSERSIGLSVPYLVAGLVTGDQELDGDQDDDDDL